jgi:hypothetical protein
MALKRKTAKTGLQGGLKLGRRKAERTPAGTAVLYGRALVGNEGAREELRDAYSSARKAYRRSSDRSGRPDLVALLGDRKASREASNALTSLKRALRIAERKRKKPKSAKGPAIAVIAVAGAGTALAVSKKKSANEAPGTAGANGVPAGAA